MGCCRLDDTGKGMKPYDQKEAGQPTISCPQAQETPETEPPQLSEDASG